MWSGIQLINRLSCRSNELRGTSSSSRVSYLCLLLQASTDNIEMLTITSPSTRSYITVSQALVSADKLAAECDRRQVFDLHAIRRQNHGTQSTKKKGKKRPRSVGVNIPSGNDRSKEKTWAGRAVEA